MTDPTPDQYGRTPDDFDSSAVVDVCDDCGCYTPAPHPVSVNVVLCPPCYSDAERECYVCQRTFAESYHDWYRTPEDQFGEWVCERCGRRREKVLELPTHSFTCPCCDSQVEENGESHHPAAERDNVGEKLPYDAVARYLAHQ